MKLEASAFNGREPDQNRYDIEVRAARFLRAAPVLQPEPRAGRSRRSFGRLASPEQLEPHVSVRRSTVSVSYNAPVAQWWQTTLPSATTHPRAAGQHRWLLESAAAVRTAHSLFARDQHVGKDELFLPDQPLYGRTFTIQKLSLGYVYDFARLAGMRLGMGALVSTYEYPYSLTASYGARPRSFMVFIRARL